MEEQDILHNQFKIWKGSEILLVSAHGAFGGISTLWPQSLIILLDYSSLPHYLVSPFIHIPSNMIFLVVNNYMHVQYNENIAC